MIVNRLSPPLARSTVWELFERVVVHAGQPGPDKLPLPFDTYEVSGVEAGEDEKGKPSIRFRRKAGNYPSGVSSQVTLSYDPIYVKPLKRTVRDSNMRCTEEWYEDLEFDPDLSDELFKVR
jgi:hypothetical protein